MLDDGGKPGLSELHRAGVYPLANSSFKALGLSLDRLNALGSRQYDKLPAALTAVNTTPRFARTRVAVDHPRKPAVIYHRKHPHLQ